ncbi:MAG: hypothetical protein VB092_01985 [Oscillospiraceae bacterium]|nr:hypothetical protein [Oscillospiraceae bacterium]
MQLKVAKALNNILILITVLVLALAGGYYYVYSAYPQYKTPYLIGFVLVAVISLWVFKWLEANWDKRVITKMARDGKIAVANIKSAQRVMRMRDSSFTNYWLYEFAGDIITPDLTKLVDTKFYDKMNFQTDEVPQGTVFVTYDEAKPGQIFIIPNVLISHLPALMPVVQKLEKNKDVGINYVNAYYNKGMVIKTFKETIAEQKHAAEQKKLERQEAAAAHETHPDKKNKKKAKENAQ